MLPYRTSMLNVKYRLILAARASSNSWRGPDSAPPMRSLVVNTHPQVAPCGGNTPKDWQCFHKHKTLTLTYLIFSEDSFLICCCPSKVLIFVTMMN